MRIQKELCKRVVQPHQVAYTIFPNETQIEGTSLDIETKDIQSLPIEHLKLGKPVMPFIVGCVDYRYGYSSTLHQTGFVYQVYGDKNNQGIQTGGIYPADQLVFQAYGFGGKYAY